MKKYILNVRIQIFIALLLSIIIGIIFKGNQVFSETILTPLGNVFINLIKCFMVPLIFFSIIVGILNLESIKQFRKIGIKILLFFMITTLFASIIGLGIGKLFDFNIDNIEIVDNTNIDVNINDMNVISTFFAFIPDNLITVFINGNIIQIIFLAIVFGCVLLKNKEKMKSLVNFSVTLNEFFKKIISGILKIIPIAIFVLLTPIIIKNDFSSLFVLGKVMLAYILACLLHILFIYIPIIIYTKKIKLTEFFKIVFPTLVLAFSSASSLVTLGNSIESANKIGVKDEISRVTLPFGATINMDGTAIFLSIMTLFIATIYGIELTIVQMLLLIFVVLVTSIGTPGIPGASLVIIAITLESVGLPISGIALIAGIDIFLEMFGTVVNVLGDIVCSMFIDKKSKNILNT